MLDMGFEQDIRDILKYMKNEHRQTLFFTASWDRNV